MLRLAGREADGAIINWLSPDDVRTVAGVVDDAAGGAEREIVARIFVCPSENAEVVRAAAKFAIAAYLNVPVYAEFHRWLGRSERLQPMWDAWAAGDRKAAVAAIPDDVVDELVVHGSPEACRRAHPGVLRQRGDDEQPGRHAARPGARVLGGGAVAGAERRLSRRPGGARLTPPGGGSMSRRWSAAGRSRRARISAMWRRPRRRVASSRRNCSGTSSGRGAG